jgi:exopolysaccharide production protein ExoZ
MSTNNNGEVPFIHLLRAFAPLPVVWAHIAMMVEWQFHTTWVPLTLFYRLIGNPLHLEQAGGHLGVIVFFLISGYIISFVAEREDRLSFALKRVFRLFPALAVAVAVLFVLNTIGSIARPNIPATDYLLSLFLLDQFFWPGSTVLSVTWTLFPEIVFYALVCIFMPLIKTRPIASTVALAAASYAAIAVTGIFGTAPAHASHLAYLPMFIIGRAFFLLQTGKMSREVALVFVASQLLILYAVFDAMWPDQMWANQQKAWTYPMATIIFFSCMLWNPKVSWRPVRFLGDISYSLYLIHIPVGYFVMDNVHSALGFSLAFLVAVAASIGAAWMSYRFVETPGRELGRKLIKRMTTKRSQPVQFANAEQ